MGFVLLLVRTSPEKCVCMCCVCVGEGVRVYTLKTRAS